MRTLLDIEPRLEASLRIPLLEIGFPALRRRPETELEGLLALVEALIQVDGQVDVFEYSLARLLASQLEDARHPGRTRPNGRDGLGDHQGPARDLLAILAHHGHPDTPAVAQDAWGAGLRVLNLETDTSLVVGPDWPGRLDAALARLDDLRLPDKRQLLLAMATTVDHDGQTTPGERELLRAIAAALHMPLPLNPSPQGQA